MSGEPTMPRTQGGPSPQHLLVTLLGDYWLRQDGDLPSAGLIDLLAEFGISRSSARAALNRLRRRRLVDTRKAGRRTYYRLVGSVAERVADGARRIAAFGTPVEWDGTWTVVAFSVPESRRESRHLLRSRLRWCGFAPLYDAVWVSASARPEDTVALLADLDIASATVFTGTSEPELDRSPLAAWDLRGLAAVYTSFVEETEALLEAVRAGRVSPRQALVARTRLMDTYRRFPGMDPGLPSHRMPPGWPRDRACALFARAYNALGPLAEARVKQLMGVHDGAAADRARFQSVQEMLDGSD
ncbi:PaaX family transcriptional regulator C-terminal domain-containing protein [Streptomyces luomodiensis]|uniref:PaaX family transcriptional regulator C-terminal domain-containing protein n=1 Tax=Streptomyces luomodiensis TaxID=3026192 RepID=A0ABY9UZ88_9ACTN|nr:PaaX family transcriptional regulator C-terminal domain-containing protein [Streptomyces sp. SCA4-21]WNE95169.1 PaaX family transcriptional regulator C-terminal domain-containing protein [Streptomyces sp. SCA4-21]